MGVVSKLTELARVQLTLTAAPAAPSTATQTLAAQPSTAAGVLIAEQLMKELQLQKRSAA